MAGDLLHKSWPFLPHPILSMAIQRGLTGGCQLRGLAADTGANEPPATAVLDALGCVVMAANL